jgi:hypothetical protein
MQRARGYGADFSTNYSAASWVNIFGTLSLLNARFSSYPNAPNVFLVPGVGMSSGVWDLSGAPLPQAPNTTASVGFDVHKPIGTNLEAHLNLMARYTSSFQFYAGGAGPQNYAFQPPYTLVNISGDVEWDLSHDGQGTYGLKSFKIGFFIYNATDRQYYIARNMTIVFGASGAYDTVAPPLTYGLRISVEM